MYPRQISDEQVESIWEKAMESSHTYGNITQTIDESGDIFTIFTSWREVETLAELIYEVLPQSVIDDCAPTWAHLPEDKRPNPLHHIEWAIGEFGFDDQFVTCSQCYSAIDTCDSMPMHGYNYDVGELYCRNCLKDNKGDCAEMYISYCAHHLEDDGEILRWMIDPADYGYILTNPQQAYGPYSRYDDFLDKYEGVENFPLEDHPDLPYDLTHPDSNELQRLAKAARLIDENLRIVAQYGDYSTYLIWAKFNEPISEDDPATNLIILNYALSRVFAKYKLLSQSKGK